MKSGCRDNLEQVYTILLYSAILFFAARLAFNTPNPFIIFVLYFYIGHAITSRIFPALTNIQRIVINTAISPLLSILFFALASMASINNNITTAILLIVLLITRKRVNDRKENISTPMIITASILLIISVGAFFIRKIKYNSHGYMHLSIVRSIMNNGIPPPDPFFHGKTITYPYMYHFFTALCHQLSGIPDILIAFLINAISVTVILSLIYLISKAIDHERTYTKILSIILAFAGVNVISMAISKITEIDLPRMSALSFLYKFTYINQTAMSLSFIALFIYAAVLYSIKAKYAQHILFLSLLGIAYFYPIYGPLTVLMTAAILLWQDGKEGFKILLKMITLLAIITAPYALTLAYSREGTTTISLSTVNIIFAETQLVLIAAPLLILAAYFIIKSDMRTRTRKTLALLITAPIIAYILFTTNGTHYTEYKFMYITYLPLGICAASGIWFALKRHALLAKAIITLLAIATIIFMITDMNIYAKHKLNYDFKETDDGLVYLPHTSDESKMFSWAKENTAKNSIFLDNDNLIPVFAHRQLFLAENNNYLCHERIKYNLCPNDYYTIDFYDHWFIEVLDYNPRELEMMKKIQMSVLIGTTDKETTRKAINYLQRLDEDVYLVFRDGINPEPNSIVLSASSKEFHAEKITVYKIDK